MMVSYGNIAKNVSMCNSYFFNIAFQVTMDFPRGLYGLTSLYKYTPSVTYCAIPALSPILCTVSKNFWWHTSTMSSIYTTQPYSTLYTPPFLSQSRTYYYLFQMLLCCWLTAQWIIIIDTYLPMYCKYIGVVAWKQSFFDVPTCSNLFHLPATPAREHVPYPAGPSQTPVWVTRYLRQRKELTRNT